MQPIKPAASRPFGDDEDANSAVRDPEVLEVVGKLSVESRRLAGSVFRRREAYQRQRQQVAGLRGLIASRARSLHVDEERFLEAARAELERQSGKRVVIAAMPPAEQHADETERRLAREYADAELHEQAMLSKLGKARERFTDAQAATRIARDQLDAYRARTKRVAS